MSQEEREILYKWIEHVMYMLAARAEVFSLIEREELAELTAQVREKLIGEGPS